MPFVGAVFYFSKTRRNIPYEIIYAKLFSVFILTVVLPILFFFFLKSLKAVSSFNTLGLKERKLPLLINSFIIILILYRVFPKNEISGLYFYFLGILCSLIICFVLVYFKIKSSIHMIGISGFFVFCILVGLYYQKNINGTIAILLVCMGGVATSRLYLKAHVVSELIYGLIIGILPQISLYYFWSFGN